MRKRIAGVWFIIFAILIMQVPVTVVDAQQSNTDFVMEGNVLTKYIGSEKEVILPDSVVSIGRSAFEKNNFIEKVVFSNSVENINEYAFWGCNNLSEVVVGNNIMEIGDFAFANCVGLKKFSVPPSVVYIGIDAFQNCMNLEQITIPFQTMGIHETAFEGCDKLIIDAPKGCYAYNYALDFYERRKGEHNRNPVSSENNSQDFVQDVVEDEIVDNVDDYEDLEDTVENNTFNQLGSSKVVANNALVFLDNTMGIYDGLNSSGVANEGANSAVQNYDKVIESVYDNLSSAVSLPKFTIVDGRVVADQAFYKNTLLTEFELPAGITEIGQFSFARSGLNTIKLAEGLEKIGYGAFYHCNNLTDFTIPDSVLNIEPKAFLKSRFYEDESNYDQEGFLINGNALIAYKGNSQKVVIPEGIRIIAAECFKDNKALESVVFPDSLLTVGEAAFENCVELNDVRYNDGLLYIKDRAFYNTKVTNISFPDSLKELGLKCFSDDVAYISDTMNYTISHENTAERLANGEYRNNVLQNAEPLIVVDSDVNIDVTMDGIDNQYYFSFKVHDGEELKGAFSRLFQKPINSNTVYFKLGLTDFSSIPINKLGKQALNIKMLLPSNFLNRGINIFTVDRNGQIEKVEYNRFSDVNGQYVTYKLNNVSFVCISDNGMEYNGEATEEGISNSGISSIEEISTESVLFNDAAHPVAENTQMGLSLLQNKRILLFCKLGGSLASFIIGAWLIISSFKFKI